MANPPFSIEEHLMHNLFTYLRIFLTLVGWAFVRLHSVVFLLFIMTVAAISLLDSLIAACNPKVQPIQTMVTLIADKILTYTLIFAVISNMRQSDSLQQEQLPLLTVFWTLVFFLDFTSTWFKHFSVLMAGPRSHLMQSRIEAALLYPQSNAFVKSLTAACYNIWIGCYFCLYSNSVMLVKHAHSDWLSALIAVSGFIAYLQLATLAIELKQGFVRIIDLDCDDYNKKYNLK